MRSVSTPDGISQPDKPNLASTLWRAAYDQKNKDFILTPQPARMPSVFPCLTSISQRHTREDAHYSGGKVCAGNTPSKFETAAAFTFASAH
jgi:hypothetical protein